MISNAIAVALAAAQAVAPVTATDTVEAPAPVAVVIDQAPVSPPSAAPVVLPANVPTLPPTSVTLWRNVSDGMPVAALRASYPLGSGDVTYKDDRTVLGDVQIMEGCKAKVNIMHPTGQVKEIVMRGEGSIAGRCSLKLITALSGKYGEPLEKDKVKGSLFGREGKNYVWSRDGVTLQLKRYTNGPLGGGGLFAASWELRYSANAVALDL